MQTEISISEIELSLKNLEDKYKNDDVSFDIQYISEGYVFLTKPQYQSVISSLIKQKENKKLSTSSLETLSIIAYKQPITKVEVEKIRGVNCDYAIHRLLEKQLIEIKGKADTIGKPLLYATTKKFMDHFGLKNLKDLPSIQDVRVSEESTIGKSQE